MTLEQRVEAILDQFSLSDNALAYFAVEHALKLGDAEAAAMRERAAEIADGEAGRWGDNPCADSAARVIAANIRALPATGEVGRG